MVFSQQFNAEENNIDKQLNVNNLAAGIYVLQIGDGTHIKRFKIIKD